MVKCDICGLKEAVVYQRHTGRRLCKECFFKDVLERVLNEVKRYEMFKDNDKIMLAVSGGKDSYVLMNIMTQIHDPSKLGAVTIVEGIKGYNRVEDLDQLRAYAKDHGIDIVVVSVKDLSGYTVDEMVENSIRKGLKISPCTFCGIYRRRGINLVARSLGYNKVATAHNLDDEVQTLVINMLRGDEARLIMLHPKRRRFSELFVPKIKPLRKIYEYETARYAYLKGYKPQIYECPYLNMMPSLRSKIRDILYRLEEERPGSLLKLLEEYDKLFEKEVEKREIKLNTCIICGEPTSPGRRVCKACELLIKTGLLRYEEKIL